MSFLQSAQKTFDAEIVALQNLQTQLGASFTRVCELILNNTGLLVFSGVGKSSYIAKKLAATFASTGTKAIFMHPADAAHGDLGIISKQDLWIALSYSGATLELLNLLPALQQSQVCCIGITNNPQSTLAKAVDAHLCLAVTREACPHNLAPTASTTSMLVLGDALAMAVMQAKNFSAAEFAKNHPAGALGKKLNWAVKDIMRTGTRVPLVKKDSLVPPAILEMSSKGLGMTGIVSPEGQLLGVFTDGDLRRLLDQQLDIHQLKITNHCTQPGQTIQGSTLIIDAVELMQRKKINGLLVTDQKNQPIGAFNWHDLSVLGLI